MNDCRSYYIPHHSVIKSSSLTTKVRVVFNASSKSSNGISLNDNLLTGPKLHKDICDILLKFRLHKIVFTADIKMMYRFIQVRPEDRDFQRILWRFSTDDPVQDFRLCTVTFGVASAPYLALQTLHQLALDEASTYPQASAILLHDVFVDDVISGADTLEKAISLQKELQALCLSGTFQLRKWSSNSAEFLNAISDTTKVEDDTMVLSSLNDDTSIKVLGLQWNPKYDKFHYSVASPSTICSKRSILSEVARMFDPMGFLSPVTIFVKYLIQLLWIAGIDWDESPPQSICDQWLQFVTELPLLKNLKLPRYVLFGKTDVQLHGFADASEKAYAASVYLRVIDESNKISVNLVFAQTKVAPLKRLSLPRLELLAAVLLTKLLTKVHNVYKTFIPLQNIFAWSDSSITLAWIRSPSFEWKTFVSDRVNLITSSVPASHWRHICSEQNPADCASRGVLPSKLDQNLWFHGPSWLCNPESMWPVSKIDFTTDEERRKIVTLTQAPDMSSVSFIESFSSFTKVLRIISYIFRFYYRCKRIQFYSSKLITIPELKFSHDRLILIVQRTQFSDVFSQLESHKNCTKTIQRLKPFVDNIGLLRIGGRIQRANISYDAKHQILLPTKHHLTDLIIDHNHKIHLHVGPQTLQYILSQTYWILSARKAVRSRT
ncbi:hypothetical protein K1T71_001975 [Dendrolimus kikuchii]|uniref:Uncharacterized protein n=1 Tax=Dendrolimus kikuchii TaxID=765133 RepID=A0ACC1DFG4_9NEOP|nr:hypothetical protein K1T71_001975 [Dendrolimus kikuchii]